MGTSTKTAPSGLRAKKKQQTQAEIVENAIQQFRERGVRGARLGEVAKASRVSAATLFNYFPNKGMLAEAWVRGEIDELLIDASRNPGDHGLRSAMRSLCQQLAPLVSTDRGVRLEAWEESGRAPRAALSPRHPFVLALGREQERERVRGDISAVALGEMLVDAIEGGVIAGLQGSGDATALAKALRVRVDLILDGARKKNERVAAPAAGSSKRPARR